MLVRFCHGIKQAAARISDTGKRSMEGRRGEGTQVGWRVLLSAQFWLWLAKRGSLDKSLNLSASESPVWDEDPHSDVTSFIPWVGG